MKVKEKKTGLYMHFFISIEYLRAGENFKSNQGFTLDSFWEKSKYTEQKRKGIIEYCHLNYDRILTENEREIIE